MQVCVRQLVCNQKMSALQIHLCIFSCCSSHGVLRGWPHKSITVTESQCWMSNLFKYSILNSSTLQIENTLPLCKFVNLTFSLKPEAPSSSPEQHLLGWTIIFFVYLSVVTATLYLHLIFQLWGPLCVDTELSKGVW